ncbi:MAG: dTDP-4-dehydrorhamnose 3,5-epimerase family protein [Candidatus Doudnabacteria bacterium]
MQTTEFKINNTAIPGLLEIDVNMIEDSRGWFQEKYQREKLVAAGFPNGFVPVQHSVSFNRAVGVTRGFHAEPWEKYIGIITGRIFAVFVDLRKGGNFGKKVEMTIDENKTAFVPRGVANSFQTLEEGTYYSYLVNDFWSAEKLSEYKFVNLADTDLSVEWPIALDKAIISDNDMKHPMLKDVKPL